MVKTLCPIKDIKGWQRYNNCPYTKTLFSKSEVSSALSTTGRKERFFKTLQKNVGHKGYLTKEAMKKTLGDFKHELGANDFYKLCVAIFPDEKQRFTMNSAKTEMRPNVKSEPKSEKKEPISQKPNIEKVQSVPVSQAFRRMKPRTIPPRTFSQGENDGGEKDGERKTDFYRAIRATMGKNNS